MHACRKRLKDSIVAVLTASGRSSDLHLGDTKPGVILIVGVNGGGKTTTIGKLAHKLGQEGAQAGPLCPSSAASMCCCRP
jgi:fused signal recognition particle receptor